MTSKTRGAAVTRKKKTVARKPARASTSRVRAVKAKARTRAAKTLVVSVPSAPARRAVFIDVENTSSEAELMRVFDELKVDLKNGATQVSAIGNWRMVGQQLGRSLAQRGAQLVHSAPAARVSDWSDLWIAVQAGMWLGRSRPGDEIDIISHDRAFDAVGDAAAQLGVTFRRITYRSTGAAVSEPTSGADHPGRGRRRRRGGRSDGGPAPHAERPSRSHGRSITSASPPRARIPEAAPTPTSEPAHGASPNELHMIIARLVGSSPSRTITLDALTVALKAAGFQRPPGSPRLVTRLRQIKGVEILPNGKLQLHDDGRAAQSESTDVTAALPRSEETPSVGATERRPRRRGRRGGRGRSTAAASIATDDSADAT